MQKYLWKRFCTPVFSPLVSRRKKCIICRRHQVFDQNWPKLRSILRYFRCVAMRFSKFFVCSFSPLPSSLSLSHVSIDLLVYVGGGAHSIFNYSQLVSRSSHECRIELCSTVRNKNVGRRFPPMFIEKETHIHTYDVLVLLTTWPDPSSSRVLVCVSSRSVNFPRHWE